MHRGYRGVVAFRDVMAFAEPATSDEDAIHLVRKSPEDERRVYPSGAHDADDFHIGWVL
jgi:hypothetical protein